MCEDTWADGGFKSLRRKFKGVGTVFIVILVSIVKSPFNMRAVSLVEIFRSQTCGKQNA